MKKAIISLLSATAGAAVAAMAVNKKVTQKKDKIQKMSDKHFELFMLMKKWVRVKQDGKNLATFFDLNGFKRIAIYGMSYAGETLVEELKGTDIEIAYGIDRNTDGIYADIDVLTPEQELENVDAIVVTAITFFEEIEEMLSEKVDCPIISLEDILCEV